MKKTLLALSLSALLFSSCATIFGGAVTDCQRTKPKEGEPARKVRVAALILDIVLFWPSVAVDFATNAIYRPCTMQMEGPR
jgi:hypothetical protein